MADIVDLDIDVNEVDRIHHLADIHIRNYGRHKEYRSVFKNVYKKIDKNKTNNSLIVLVGDIAHSKTEMSPELVDLMSEFLTNMADIRPTILIPGNHDANVKNSNRLDALTPIVDNLNHEDLHYIRENGLYRVGNVVFSHFSVFSKPSEYIPASEIPDKYKKIVLYHGTVDRSITEHGYVLKNEDVKNHKFLNYDIGLLGDIHKDQKVSKSEVEEMVVSEDELNKYLESGWTLVGKHNE